MCPDAASPTSSRAGCSHPQLDLHLQPQVVINPSQVESRPQPCCLQLNISFGEMLVYAGGGISSSEPQSANCMAAPQKGQLSRAWNFFHTKEHPAAPKPYPKCYMSTHPLVFHLEQVMLAWRSQWRAFTFRLSCSAVKTLGSSGLQICWTHLQSPCHSVKSWDRAGYTQSWGLCGSLLQRLLRFEATFSNCPHGLG